MFHSVWYRIIEYDKVKVGLVCMSDLFLTINCSNDLEMLNKKAGKDLNLTIDLIKFFCNKLMECLQSEITKWGTVESKDLIMKRLPDIIPPFQLTAVEGRVISRATQEHFNQFTQKVFRDEVLGEEGKLVTT